MNNIKGYLIECEGRELFLRENIEWAIADEHYKVTPLVAQEAVLDSENMHKTEPSFDDYVEVSGQLYDLQQEHIKHLETKLEECIEVLEGIVEISVPTEHLIENKAKLLLIAEACRKLLAAKE